MPELPRDAPEADPLLSYIAAELARPLSGDGMPKERDRHYRALLDDLRKRAERASSRGERAFLAQRASAIACLRLEDARGMLATQASASPRVAFGALVRRFRRRAGLSQSELAKRSGIDPAYVNRMEKAASEEPVIPSRNVVAAMAAALGLAQPETDSLLVAAGYAPVAILSAGGWRPEFALLADFLADPLVSELDRAEFRQVLRALIAHWRGYRALPRPDLSPARGPAAPWAVSRKARPGGAAMQAFPHRPGRLTGQALPASAQPERPRPRALLVEDSEGTGHLLRALVESDGFEVVLTPGGPQALDKARAVQPSVILLEESLQGTAARDGLRRLKEDPVTREIPVVVLSPRPHLLSAADRRRAAAVVAKPFDVNEVRQALRRARSEEWRTR